MVKYVISHATLLFDMHPALRGISSIGPRIALMALLVTTIPILVIKKPAANAENRGIIEAGESGDVSAASGSNRFVVWEDNTPGNLEILFKRSTDGGATWGTAKNLSMNPGLSRLPHIAVSGANVYVVWTQESADGLLRDVFFIRSTDNGATWKNKINLSGNGNSDSPLIVVSGSKVFMAWDTNDDQGFPDIFFRRSTDNGATWKPAVNLSNNPGEYSFMGGMAVSGSNIYIVWTDYSPGNVEIFFRRSTDGGATWKPVVNLSKTADESRGPSIAVSGPNVYVTWDETTSGSIGLLFKRSTDNGATWKPAKNLNAVPSSAQVVASGSTVYVIWTQIRNSANYDLYVRTSDDKGVTWGPKFKLNTAVLGIRSFDFVTSGDKLYIVWRQPDSGGDQEIYLRQTADNGASWKSPVNVSNDILFSSSPDIALSGSSLYVAWNKGGGPDEIWLKRSTDGGATWKPTVNLSSNSGSSGSAQIGV
jgi:hypothetical protein